MRRVEAKWSKRKTSASYNWPFQAKLASFEFELQIRTLKTVLDQNRLLATCIKKAQSG